MKQATRDEAPVLHGNVDPWTPEAVALLGTKPDQAIANKLGITYRQVYKKRQELNISASRSRDPNHEWTQEQIALLGTNTDIEIANKLAKSRVIVTNKRIKLNIPPFVKSNCVPAVIPAEIVEQ